jgi:hypothetical protein
MTTGKIHDFFLARLFRNDTPHPGFSRIVMFGFVRARDQPTDRLFLFWQGRKQCHDFLLLLIPLLQGTG